MKEDFYPVLQAGDFYHIYNRGNNRENIFYKEDNYHYFLKKYDAYLSGFVDTYAYCLLPNHFHLLVRVKERKEVVSAARLSSFKNLESLLKNLVKLYQKPFADSLCPTPNLLTSSRAAQAVFFRRILNGNL